MLRVSQGHFQLHRLAASSDAVARLRRGCVRLFYTGGSDNSPWLLPSHYRNILASLHAALHERRLQRWAIRQSLQIKVCPVYCSGLPETTRRMQSQYAVVPPGLLLLPNVQRWPPSAQGLPFRSGWVHAAAMQSHGRASWRLCHVSVRWL